MSEDKGGVNKTFTHAVDTASSQEAERLYQRGRDRLHDVNNWHRFAGKGSAVFQRMDEAGNALTGAVQRADFIRIELPGVRIGRVFDWVKVEALTSGEEHTQMTVRPCADPTSKEATTAHFLHDAATSTFRVTRDGLKVAATILGKNEKPNSESENLLQKTRDILVGIGAIAGASGIQWNRLAEAFLETTDAG